MKNLVILRDDNAEKPLEEKVLEILKRPRKSIIDWKATFEDMKIELLNLQNQSQRLENA